MSLIVTVEPTIEPVTLTEAKTHLRIYENTDFDTEITNMIKSARRYVERLTGRALITQTFELKLDGFEVCTKIPRPPLQSITSIQYQDGNNVTQTLAASNYTVDADSEPGRLVQSSSGTYPSTYDDLDAVTITYVAGYGATAADVPEDLKMAVKFKIEELFERPTGDYAASLSNALESIMYSYKIDWMAL